MHVYNHMHTCIIIIRIVSYSYVYQSMHGYSYIDATTDVFAEIYTCMHAHTSACEFTITALVK